MFAFAFLIFSFGVHNKWLKSISGLLLNKYYVTILVLTKLKLYTSLISKENHLSKDDNLKNTNEIYPQQT